MTFHLRDKIGLFLTTNILSKKLFGKNRPIIFNRSITRKILDHYGGDSAHQVDHFYGNLGYGLIHYSFILNHKPKRILCIGSRKGYIPALCALACQENGFGHVDFVDAGYDQGDENHWAGVGWWKKIDLKKHFSFLDVKDWLTIHVMTTKEFAKKSKHNYQYIYIDGDHSYEGVKTDYQLFWKKLDRNGLMVFHDVTIKNDPALPPFGVWKFWNKLKGNKITFPYSGSGLGIMQKV